MSHEEPHFSASGFCRCECSDCTGEDFSARGKLIIWCRCEECNADMCGLHEAPYE